jgi:hypothetical protein
MKRFLLVLLLLGSAAFAQSAPADRWSDWRPFLGTWQGDGSGEPGQGSGAFTFQPDLQGAVLTRHNYAQYPATKDKPAFRHDDFMLIYADPDTKKTRADYWDSEGHVIRYDVELNADKLVFTSMAGQSGPRYRLTYRKTGADALTLLFEIAPPNDRERFSKYIEATARRTSR